MHLYNDPWQCDRQACTRSCPRQIEQDGPAPSGQGTIWNRQHLVRHHLVRHHLPKRHHLVTHHLVRHHLEKAPSGKAPSGQGTIWTRHHSHLRLGARRPFPAQYRDDSRSRIPRMYKLCLPLLRPASNHLLNVQLAQPGVGLGSLVAPPGIKLGR
jgi:hypothetical protein